MKGAHFLNLPTETAVQAGALAI